MIVTGIHRNNGDFFIQKVSGFMGDKFKLLISVRVGSANLELDCSGLTNILKVAREEE